MPIALSRKPESAPSMSILIAKNRTPAPRFPAPSIPLFVQSSFFHCINPAARCQPQSPRFPRRACLCRSGVPRWPPARVIRNAELSDGERIGGRLSALARRSDIPLSGIVNCAPAKGCVWPVIGRHECGCARGSGGAAIRFYCGDLRSIMSVVRFCWNVLCSVHACHAVLLECFASGSRLSLFLCQEKRDSLRYLTFLFHAGRDRL